MWNGMGFGNWGWGGGMGLGMVLFWGALIAVIVLVVRALGNDAAAKGSQKAYLLSSVQFAAIAKYAPSCGSAFIA